MRTGRTTLTLAAALAILVAAPVSAATIRTVSSGNLHLAVRDRTATSSKIRVRTTGAIKDVNVLVRLDHAATGDVDLYLMAPNGKVIQLSTNNGGGGADFGTGNDDCTGLPTIFDDEAAIAIFDTWAPFAGTFRPEQRLARLDGSSRKGTWRLIVGDNALGAQGTLFCWKLKITV